MGREFSPYSVLMSVYSKEKPEFLRSSIESILNQTVKTDDFVLVCDGPLTKELDCVIEFYSDNLRVVRIEKNVGLGAALSVGIQHCQHELIARMDSDDISILNRCELQLGCFADNPNLDIVSGGLNEFIDDPSCISGRRLLPTENNEIVKYSKKRCPFNHPNVMYKKQAVLSAGNYSADFRMEDYYLWIRMLQNGAQAMNLPDILLLMRTPADMFKRRGGWHYAQDMLKFHWWVHKSGWSSLMDFMTGAVPHAVVCVLPNEIRQQIYKILH